MSLSRIGAIALALALATVAAWRIVASGMADLLAADTPTQALAWDPAHPAAQLARAREQLAERHPAAAIATARAVLRAEPLQAQAFVVLAEAAQAEGDAEAARALREIALRRAPRDLRTRAAVIDLQLSEGRYAEALAQIDTLLRFSSAHKATLLPLLARLAAAAPAFADALAHALVARPAWRSEMLAALLAQGSAAALDQVYGALLRDGGLSNEEAGRWLDHLGAAGEWGEAYGRWAGTLALPPGASLDAVYNGGFESAPTGIGFDWRLRDAPGVSIEREGGAATSGVYAAKVTFTGRRVPQIDLEQALLLAPGAYRLSFRARARDLRSDRGLQWAVGCQGAAEPFGVSPRLEGTFGWKAVDAGFVVPEENCPAQRLWLRNPGADGAGKILSGTIWFDDIAIDKAIPP